MQVLIVRGIIGISSLMAGEINLTCHAGSGLAAALRGVPVKVISVTHDSPVHELIVAPSIKSPEDLKGKAIAVGSVEGTAAVIMRRILQAKGLDPEKDVTLLSMNTTARLQSLLSGNVAGAMVTPPTTYFAIDRGFQVMGRGKDYMRYLQTGVVATDAAIKGNRENIVRFLRTWDRALKFYQDNPEIMISLYSEKARGQGCQAYAAHVRRRCPYDFTDRNRKSGNGQRNCRYWPRSLTHQRTRAHGANF